MLRLSFSLVIAVAVSAWIPAFAYGCNSFLEGIQQQLDGTRLYNSFPFEAFGRSLMLYSSAYGFFAMAAFSTYVLFRRSQSDAASRDARGRSSPPACERR